MLQASQNLFGTSFYCNPASQSSYNRFSSVLEVYAVAPMSYLDHAGKKLG
uniref:Uncharacterized protein n=1 Tax=Rhizophora mucronata TaxID=61149 RepID=A0A2P2PD34_RHIMU